MIKIWRRIKMEVMRSMGWRRRILLLLCFFAFLFTIFAPFQRIASANDGERIVQIEYATVNIATKEGLLLEDSSLKIYNASNDLIPMPTGEDTKPQSLTGSDTPQGRKKRVRYSLAPGTYSYEATVQLGNNTKTGEAMVKGYFVVDDTINGGEGFDQRVVLMR
jgi:hypothetical protein